MAEQQSPQNMGANCDVYLHKWTILTKFPVICSGVIVLNEKLDSRFKGHTVIKQTIMTAPMYATCYIVTKWHSGVSSLKYLVLLYQVILFLFHLIDDAFYYTHHWNTTYLGIQVW